MPSTLLDASAALEHFDAALVPLAARKDAYARFRSTRSGHEKPGRFWKIDLESISVDDRTIEPAVGSVEIACASSRVIAVALDVALAEHPALLARAFGEAIEPSHKFAQLTTAFAQLGAFIYIPADVSVDEPIVVTYRAGASATLFPYTVLLAERGARATIVERVETAANAFVCGIAEIVSGESSDISYASVQMLPDDARSFFTRAAKPGRSARIAWDCAELGSALSLADISITIREPGVDANIASIFFPTDTQHVDVESTIDHHVGNSTSHTIVKGAASGRGQARYLGNIRIDAHAQGSNADLRDDALLLSTHAHIDSIPALEIAANDVKAFHGATVGAIDDDQIFYMTSRGLDPAQAARMIALGFFEPAIARFPTQALRDELHAALEQRAQ